MSKILITGGAGFIGTHLAERFVGKHEVILVDSFRRDSLAYVNELKDKVTVVSADILTPNSLSEHLKGVDTVIHLAAIAGVSSYYNEPLRTLKTNVLGTVNVLEQVAAAKIKHFIYFSTSEVHGSDAMWVDETCSAGIGPVSDKRWVYATSKLAGENFVLRYGEEFGFRANIVRPFNIYGPRQVGEGAISNFCRAAARGEALKVYGDGSAIRAWCYVEDIVDAVESLMNSTEIKGEIFNIGNPREVETTLGLARRVASIAGNKIEREAEVHSEVRGRIPKIDKARSTLKYEPKVSLEEGLKKTITWFKENDKN